MCLHWPEGISNLLNFNLLPLTCDIIFAKGILRRGIIFQKVSLMGSSPTLFQRPGRARRQLSACGMTTRLTLPTLWPFVPNTARVAPSTASPTAPPPPPAASRPPYPRSCLPGSIFLSGHDYLSGTLGQLRNPSTWPVFVKQIPTLHRIGTEADMFPIP